MRTSMLIFPGSILVVGLACSPKEEPSPFEYASDHASARLRECNLVSEGELQLHVEGERAACEVTCMAAETECATLTNVFCQNGWGSYEFLDCLSACYTFSCDPQKLPKEAVCDGIVDCPAAEDEKGCGPDWLRACADGDQLIGDLRWCDDHEDCYDGSDEADCDELPRFTCPNGETISMKRLCDGELDCGAIEGPSYRFVFDGSDERDCASGDFFECADGSFITSIQVCDGRLDCADGGDEALSCAVLTCPREL